MGLFSLVALFMFFHGIVNVATENFHVYDFEDDNVPSEIITSGTGSLLTDTTQRKHGSKSLKWTWTTGSELAWNLTSKNIDGNKEKNGGIKIWVRNGNKMPGKCLSFCFSKIKKATGKSGCSSLTNNPPTISCFPFSLNFEGWRAAWVTYSEFNGCPSPLSPAASPSPVFKKRCYVWKITELKVTVSAGVTTPSRFHFDFFRFFDSLSQYRATRDATVPPLKFKDSSGNIACTTCNKIFDASNGLTEADVLRRHPRKAHAHQILRWSMKMSPVAIPTAVDTKKLESLQLISKRLENWYANKDTTFTKLKKGEKGVKFYLRKKWKGLLKKSSSAGKNRKELNSRGLFSAFETGVPKNAKFTWVFQYVLLPLALDHHIQSRSNEVENLACKKAKKGTCPKSSSAVSSSTAVCKKVTSTNLNNCKASITKKQDGNKDNIIQLFNYLNDQGWQSGSALGSIDYEGLGLSGFMHSAFLMRKDLETAKKLDNVIEAMKWYNYFGEIYQDTFEYKGTSADEIRTSMLFRLLTVLVMPEKNDNQKKEKIRDMDALKLWIENGLTINEGLAGFVNPDFTTSHHKTFYGSAYCIEALNAASFVYYLLQGTEFKLKTEIRTNLVKALKVFRTTAVQYSTPSSIGGRFPRYNQEIISSHVQAYAYLAAKAPTAASSNVLSATTLNTYSGVVGMFLRLYEHSDDTCDGKINANLCSRGIPRIFYLNTLGSVEIMEKVKTLASGTDAESSPSGHWFKPYAALSIHRRNDWAVTVKGFNKYNWDYEHGPGENLYGMYASHGAMLIANSESALSSKNVDEGWDWRKIPGTTVVNLDYSKMVHKDHRLYNNKRMKNQQYWDTMAGGVSLMGSKSSTKANGVFGMSVIQPTYKPPVAGTSGTFRFRKSIFFYDDMIVSLGSNIVCSGTDKEVHTNLFQDKMASPLSTTTTTEKDVFRCNDGGSASFKKSKWGIKKALVTLVDVHGNRYYIPNPKQQGLVFTRNRVQTSKKSNKKNEESTGTYCTAWLNHGKNPFGTRKEYKYLVQVHAEPSGSDQKPFLNLDDVFQVEKHDVSAHVVKFPERNNRGAVYGYVVWPIAAKITFPTGPLEFIREQSTVMVEEKGNHLFISVAHPDLKFKKVSGSPSWCKDKHGDKTPLKFDDVALVLLYCSKSNPHKVRLKPRDYAEWKTLKSIHVNGESKWLDQRKYVKKKTDFIKFFNLKNGYVTEVKYEKKDGSKTISY